MNFIFKNLDLEGLMLIEIKNYEDSRGYFEERYKKSIFFENGISDNFVQDNFSYSKKNVLRGMHYQIKPHTQSKLVSVYEGEIYDVVIDIRKESSTFGQWRGIELSDDNRKMLYIPEGFAHGFIVKSENAEVFYKTNNEYNKDFERGIRWNDPKIAIDWQIINPIVSNKDTKLPCLEDAELFI